MLHLLPFTFYVVTETKLHPLLPNSIISSGEDGQVIATDIYDSENQGSDSILKYSSGITSLDVDEYSKNVLISSKLGFLWKYIPE